MHLPLQNFNPHPYMRDDLVLAICAGDGLNFNPHPYMRDDLPSGMTAQPSQYFNPHPYMRDDSKLYMISILINILFPEFRDE